MTVEQLPNQTHPPLWPAPSELPSQIQPVAVFDYDLLPDALRPYVEDVAKRMQCPPDFVAVGIMVALSTVVGKQVGIYPKGRDTGFRVIPNLWGMLIGRPSMLKTPALDEALKELDKLESFEKSAFKDRIEQYQTDVMLAEMGAADAKDKAKAVIKKGNNTKDAQEEARQLLEDAKTDLPETPVRQRYMVYDASPEKLGELLNENPNGLLHRRDELGGFLSKLQREDAGQERSFYLEAFNGTGSYTYDRIGRGTVDIETMCVSMIGTIQPGRLEAIVRDAVAMKGHDDGLMQRFQLAVYPDQTKSWEYRDEMPNRSAQEAVSEVFSRLGNVTLPEAQETPGGTFYTRFSDEAQQLFIEWLTDLEHEIREPDIHPALEAHLAKYRSLIPSLALLIQLAESDRVTEGGFVGFAAFSKAAAWGEYLKSHAIRIYSVATNPALKNAHTLLQKIRSGRILIDQKIPETIKPRDIAKKGWAGLSSSESVFDALDMLVEFDWLRQEESAPKSQGGRPSIVYRLHQSLLQDHVSR